MNILQLIDTPALLIKEIVKTMNKETLKLLYDKRDNYARIASECEDMIMHHSRPERSIEPLLKLRETAKWLLYQTSLQIFTIGGDYDTPYGDQCSINKSLKINTLENQKNRNNGKRQ